MLVVPSPAAGPLGGNPAGDEQGHALRVFLVFLLVVVALAWVTAQIPGQRP